MDDPGELKKTIRQQKARLSALEAAEGRLRAVLESASQGVVATDPAGTILLVNAKTEELFGYTREELVGASLEILLPEGLRAAHEGHRSGYFHAPRSRPMGVGMELKGRRKNGAEFPVEISLSFVRERDGQLAVALITDISERKRLEQQMQQAHKLESLGLMAGGVAHDFNNLLTGIIGNASLVLDQITPDHPFYIYLKDVVESGEQAAKLTRQLLAYAGKAHFQIRSVDVAALVRNALERVRASVPAAVRVELDLPERLPTVPGDPAQLQQLLENLIVNAAEAIGNRPGVIRMAAQQMHSETPLAGRMSATRVPPGRYVAITVVDTGSGMNEATAARIFDPFFTTRFTGRGLGLAAARGIVDAHGGAIQVFSSPGKGTTFKVLLPALAEPAEPAPSPEEDLSGSGVILVADDEEVVRQTAKAALQRYGYAVLLAGDAPAVEDILSRPAQPLDAIVLDLSIAANALGRIKALRPNTPVLISSGYGEKEAAARLWHPDIAGFIEKPYTAAALARCVKRACTRMLS